ncbi:hypothetical protein caldi_06040 [Caldinitratiruptor microaerophilus]|uniref:Uncharacterized protein n=1 Tax=Caldinitratiruptor microaerophilus TaxID=671077 RepID=A0AA35CJC4_9FIRM|nr:hypothetical protein caldi_06040 [Caldinitratiruptor microaerophilus]
MFPGEVALPPDLRGQRIDRLGLVPARYVGLGLAGEGGTAADPAGFSRRVPLNFYPGRVAPAVSDSGDVITMVP